MYCPVPVGGTHGVIVGRVVDVRPHPNADCIRLAQVDLGVGEPVQIVFGGPPIVRKGDLVPVAPPGSRLPERDKMRRRSYRGESSYGMLCSLAELGWSPHAPDEVALLRDVAPGDSLDELMTMDWEPFVINTAELSGPNPIYGAPLLPQVISSTAANMPPLEATHALPSGSLDP